MNIANISSALHLSLSTNLEDRKKAYDFIEQNKFLPNFSIHLLSITYEESNLSFEVKQNAVIQLKNLVEQSWKNDDKNFIIHNNDKLYLINNILNIYSCISNFTIRKHYRQIIKIIIQDLFVKWKELHEFLIFSLSSDNKLVILSGIEVYSILAKHYLSIRKTIIAYDNTFTNNYLSLTKLMTNLLVNIDNDTALYISKALKVLEFSIAKDLPKVFQISENLICWIDLLMFIIKANLSPDLEKLQEENQIISNNILWKIKIQALRTIYKIYQKYGIEFGTKKAISKTACLINEKYSLIFVNMNFALLHSSFEKYLPRDIISLIFCFFSLFIKREMFIDVIEKLLDKLLNVAVKQVMIRETDFEFYKKSPKNYLYSQFDINDDENCYNLRYSVSRFLQIICEYENKDSKGNLTNNHIHFNFIYTHLLNLLKSFDDEYSKGTGDVRYKESVLYLIQTIKDSIFSHAKETIESTLVGYLLKDLNENLGMLRERACIMLKLFSEYTYKNNELLKTIIQQLCNRLQDPDLPVRIKAATAIPNYLVHLEARAILTPYLQNILEVYLKLIREIDLDELLVGLENLIDGFGENIVQFALDLVKQLVLTYRKCVQTESTITTDNMSENNEEKELDSAETSCVKTIVKLFDISSKNLELYRKLEEEVIEMLRFSLIEDHLSHLQNTLIIFSHLVNKSPQISSYTWSHFHKFVFLVSSDHLKENPELSEKIITLIMNYIINDPISFISGKDEMNHSNINKVMILTENLLQKAELNKLNDPNREEYEHCIPIKIIIILLETFKGKIDSIFDFILKLVISELSRSLTLYYKSLLVQVVPLCIYNNPELTLNILDSMNVTANLFELWMTLLRSMKHDFELRRTLYGFSSILLVDPSKLNTIILANINTLTTEIVFLTEKLINEYEKKNANDEAEVSGEDDEIEEYEEKNNNKLDDFIDDDEEEEDEIEEDNLKTFLEKQNEFIYLKTVFESLFNTNNTFYNRIMNTYNDQQKNYLFDVFKRAETLKKMEAK